MQLLDMNSIMFFLMASCRTAGCIFFNPIFGRSSVPDSIKIGLSLCLGWFAMESMGDVNFENMLTMAFIISVAKEFLVGFAIGYVMRAFLAIFTLSGYVIDMQAGYSMATLYDASSNSQISVTGNLMTIMYSLLFFVTGSHLNLVAMIVKTYDVIPVGFVHVSRDIGVYMIQMFGYMLVYAVQLAIPFIVLELLTEVSVGILMKMVPNINVFVVNIHLKMIVGLIIILTIIPALSTFMMRINAIMFERMEGALGYMLMK